MSATAVAAAPLAPSRTSDLLRGILLANPDTEVFTVGKIIESLGADRAEASLIFFSMPAIAPVRDLPQMAAVSAGLIAGQLSIGRKTFDLPKSVMNQKVPRRSLAAAIHAMAPVLEAAEKVAKPRLSWASSPAARRLLGVLLFVLAVAIAFPVIGFDPLHAAAISIISLGLAEKDGVAILLGAVAGLMSLVLIFASGLTAKILKSKVVKWLRKLVRRAAGNALARLCERRGWVTLAAILQFEWLDVLLMWDPERRAAEKTARANARKTAPTTRRERPAQREPERRASAAGAARKTTKLSPSMLTA